MRCGGVSYFGQGNRPDGPGRAVPKGGGGGGGVHPHIAARVVQELDGASHHDMANFAHLSEREREVLRLIAEGLSNAKIAERLVPTDRTGKSTFTKITGKRLLVTPPPAPHLPFRPG